MYEKCSIEHKMYAREFDVRKVLHRAQNFTPESLMYKKCSIEHKMYPWEFDVQEVLHRAQNVLLGV